MKQRVLSAHFNIRRVVSEHTGYTGYTLVLLGFAVTLHSGYTLLLSVVLKVSGLAQSGSDWPQI